MHQSDICLHTRASAHSSTLALQMESFFFYNLLQVYLIFFFFIAYHLLQSQPSTALITIPKHLSAAHQACADKRSRATCRTRTKRDDRYISWSPCHLSLPDVEASCAIDASVANDATLPNSNAKMSNRSISTFIGPALYLFFALPIASLILEVRRFFCSSRRCRLQFSAKQMHRLSACIVFAMHISTILVCVRGYPIVRPSKVVFAYS
jgi:hypothetical protein